MQSVKQLRTIADLDALLAESQQRLMLIFKHSTACPLSARAHRHWDAFLASPEAAQVGHAFVRVIEERPVSLALAGRVGVRHESPQALLIKGGRALWHNSHRGVTTEALQQAVSTANPA